MKLWITVWLTDTGFGDPHNYLVPIGKVGHAQTVRELFLEIL
jgi:hypothetical protein